MDPVGVEPISAGLQGQLASRVHASPKFFVALSGLEPEFPTWKASELNQLFYSAIFFSGQDGIRIHDLLIASQTFYQTELQAHNILVDTYGIRTHDVLRAKQTFYQLN